MPQVAILLGITPGGHTRAYCRGLARHTSVVSIDELLTDCGSNSVITDDRTAMIQVVQRLSALGYQRLMVVRGPQHFSSFRARYQGALEGLRACGIPEPRCLTIDAPATFDGGREAARPVVAGLHGPRLAVVTANDMQALGLLAEAQAHGQRVPDDLAVVGFDDVAGAAASTPSLSTVRTPRRLMGQLAVHLALECRDMSDPPPTVVSVAPMFIERGSTPSLRRRG